MKGILVVLDGMGDLPSRQLNDKTPLESAEMPNLNFLAARGEMGLMHPVKLGFVPESDEAIVSIFGNRQIDSTRGQLEARGADLKLTRGDLAFRVNFATIDSMEEGNIIDRRAGRTLTTEEAKELSKSLNKINMSVKFVFKPTIQHRAALVFKGGFSDNISGNDSIYTKGKSIQEDKVKYCKPLDEDENSQYSANIANEFIEKAYEVLDRHPVNQERRKKGLLPANYLMIRGAGIEVPKLKIYRKWASVAYMPLEIGFAKMSGMTVYSFDYPPLKGLDAYQNLHDGLKKACDFAEKTINKIKGNFDYVYVHIKETDLPGHDNKPIEKKLMFEYIDKTLFKFIRRFAPPNKIKVVVIGDHSTPCKLKRHSADPVPVLFYNDSELKEKHFSEAEAAKGKLGVISGNDLLRKVGFDK
jgi:2,3-bisphosphoglycerate-independent phosphoglycerate mutase